VIAVFHFRPHDSADHFLADARRVLAALAARPGYVSGTVGRAADDESEWVMVTEWESTGAYRRGIGGYDIKMIATEFFAQAQSRPSAFETLLTADSSGALTERGSDRTIGS